MPSLVIRVDCKDPSDLDWLRNRCVGAVENEVDTAAEENRLDDAVEVSWEIDND